MSGAVVRPDRILEQLDELWSGLGSEQDGEVLRACAMTLLVATAGAAADTVLAETLAGVIRNHPSRVIVLGLTEDTARSLSASVSARCWLPLGRRQQICCEQIEITVTAGALAELPPVALALAAPDLPVAVWVRTWRLLDEEALRPVFRLADKLIVDSSAVGAADGLKRVRSLAGIARAVADLSWTRLTPWRAALAEAFEQPDLNLSPAAVERIEIRFDGERLPAEALYLAAWLEGAPSAPPIRLARASVGPARGLRSVVFEGSGMRLPVSRAAEGGIELRREGRLIARLGAPPPEAELLGEELSLLGRDAVFETVLERALNRLRLERYGVGDSEK